MSKLGDTYRNLVLDAFFAFFDGSPVDVFFALWANDPTLDLDAEVDDAGSYAREQLFNTSFGPASNGRITYSEYVTLPPADTDWGAVTHWVLLDDFTASGLDNIITYGRLDGLNPNIIETGDTFRMPPDSWPIYLR